MSEGEINGSVKVTFTVKELFSELLTKMGAIESKLDTKANSMELSALKENHDRLADKVLVLETEKKDNRRFNALWVPIILQLLTNGLLIYATWPRK